MYKITNLTKIGPVRLTGQFLPTQHIDVGGSIVLSPSDYQRYAPCIDILNRSGKINVVKQGDCSSSMSMMSAPASAPVAAPVASVQAPEQDPSADEDSAPAYTQAELSTMTVADLTPLATSLGINPQGLRKDALISAILDASQK